MKKKILAISILCALLVSASLTGCANQDNTTTASSASSALESSSIVQPVVDDDLGQAEDEEIGILTSDTVENEDGSTTTTETLADGSTVVIQTAADGSVTKKKTASDGTVTETVKSSDGTVTKTTTNADGSSTTTVTAADGTQSVASAPASSAAQQSSSAQPAASVNTSSANTTTQTTASQSAAQTTASASAQPTASQTESSAAAAATSSEAVTSHVYGLPPASSYTRTIDPQYVCDQVNARMTEVGMIDAVTEGVNFGLTPQESLDEIHEYMGWFDARSSLFLSSNEKEIDSALDCLQRLHDQCHVDSAWMEIENYMDHNYNIVSNIEDAEFVTWIIYR